MNILVILQDCADQSSTLIVYSQHQASGATWASYLNKTLLKFYPP